MADIVTTKRIIDLPDASQDITENDYFAIDNENGDTGKIPANLFTSTSREAKPYDNTKTYAVGDHCIYQNRYYVCTTAIETPEVWTAAHWEQTDIGEEITALNSTLMNNTINALTPQTGITIEDGGYTVIGKLVIVNVRIKATANITANSQILTGLPPVKNNNSKNTLTFISNTGLKGYITFTGVMYSYDTIATNDVILIHTSYITT